jgi:RNA polymerase sigma-70 factor (ECF subfamily)
VDRRLAAQSAGPGSSELSDWVRLFEAQFDYVYWTLRNFGVSPADAEDLVQEVFLVMWRRRTSYDASRPLRPWIAGIAFRALQEHRRRGRREQPGGLLDAPDEAPCQDEHLEAAQARQLVTGALARVPEKQRVVLVMHEIDGIAMREIAEALSVPLFTLYSRLQRGRRAFAKEVRRAEALSALGAAFAAVPPTALLARSAGTGPAPTRARQRNLGRLRAMLLLGEPGRAHHERSGPGQQPAPAPTGVRPRLPVALGAAGVAASALVALLVLRAAPARRALPSALEAGAAAPGARAAALERDPAPARAWRASAWPVRGQDDDGEDAARVSSALARGLVGYWRFDEGRGSTTARDLSGQGNDCSLRRLDPDAVWGDGALSGALALTGRGWLECPVTGALAGLHSEITIGAWVTRGTVLRNYHALVARQKDAGREDEFMFGFANGELVFASHAWRGRLMRPLPPGLGRWFHVAVTRHQDGTVILYADGVELGRAPTGRGVLPGGGNPLIIGAAVNGSDPDRTEARFDGGVDELVIYDRVLAPREIEALAARRQPRLSL